MVRQNLKEALTNHACCPVESYRQAFFSRCLHPEEDAKRLRPRHAYRGSTASTVQILPAMFQNNHLCSLFIVLSLAACGSDAGTTEKGATASEGPERPNVLLVTLDTTRADRLGYAGYEKARTPHLDALAASSANFTNARTHVPLTLPSHSSLMTGLLPTGHGIHVNMQGALPSEVGTLAESFKRAGYSTGASIAAWVLASRYGLARGFDFYDEVDEELDTLTTLAERPGEDITAASLGWLNENGDQPFFFWAHYFDAHDAYLPPEGYRDFAHPYDGEISFVDHQVGQLLAWLEESGEAENTLVIIVGDHGEDLEQHGEGSHGILIYDATLHIPLLMRMPGKIEPSVIKGNVGLIDIAPTICELIDLNAPGSMDGQSLVPALKGEEMDANHPFFAEGEYSRRSFGWSRLRSFIVDDWKLIDSPSPELFNLKMDPGETNSLAETEPERVTSMREAMTSFLASKTVRDAMALEASGDADAALAALGYVAGTSGAIDDDPMDLQEPREMMAVFKGSIRADGLLKRKKPTEALPLIEWILEQSPESEELYGLLGNCYFQLDRFEDAILAYEQALRNKGDNPHHLTRLGNSHLQLKNYDKAEECYLAVLAIDPNFGAAHSRLGLINGYRQEWTTAINYFQTCVEMDPRSVNARCNLANALCGSGYPKEGLKELDAGLEVDSKSYPLLRTKIVTLNLLGKKQEAIELNNEALKYFPGDKQLSTMLERLIEGPKPRLIQPIK